MEHFSKHRLRSKYPGIVQWAELVCPSRGPAPFLTSVPVFSGCLSLRAQDSGGRGGMCRIPWVPAGEPHPFVLGHRYCWRGWRRLLKAVAKSHILALEQQALVSPSSEAGNPDHGVRRLASPEPRLLGWRAAVLPRGPRGVCSEHTCPWCLFSRCS